MKPDFTFSENPDAFFSDLRAWEQQVRDSYERAIRNKGNPALHMKGEFSINLSAMLNELPLNERNKLLFHYKKLIRFEEVVSAVDPVTRTPTFRGKNPAWRVNVDPSQISGPDANPLALIWNRMAIQQRYNDFTVSSNILTADFLENIYTGMKEGTSAGIEAGKSVFVMDSETAGIVEEYGGIRQLSGITGTTSTDPTTGKVALSINPGVMDEHFNVARMQLGMVADEHGTLKRLSDWVRETLVPAGALPKGSAGDGSAFAKGARPFLEQMLASDYIVAHNILFDLNQLMTNVVQTNEYLQNINGFADLVDQVAVKISTPGVLKDTLEIARALPGLANIAQAPELSFKGERSIHSLENIALESNLFSLMERDGTDIRRLLGVDGATSMMHAAEVDTAIEGAFLKYSLSDELTTDSRPIGAVRGGILRSYAPTPISHIGDPRHLGKDVLRALIEETQSGKRESIKIWDMNKGQQISPIGIALSDTDTILDMVSKTDDYFTDIGINPIEQEILATRRALTPDATMTPESMIDRLGMWRQYTGSEEPYQGWHNKLGNLFKRGVRPSTEDYFELQERFAAAGMPFSGISEVERTITAAISRAGGEAGGPTLSVAEQNLARLGEDLGISRFANYDRAYIGGISGAVSLPIELLQEAENQTWLPDGRSVLRSHTADPAGSPHTQLFRVSHGRGPSGDAFLNLVYDFDDQDGASRLANWIETLTESTEINGRSLSDMGLTRSGIKDMAAALRETGQEKGVRVGRLKGAAAENAHTMLESLFQGIDRDDIIPMRAGMIDSAEGTTRVGAFFLDRFSDVDGFMDSYRTDLSTARRLNSAVGGITELMGKKGVAQGAESIMSGVKGTANALKRYNDYKGKAAIGLGIASVALGGYYMNKRSKAKEIFNEPLAPMPIESRGDYLAHRKEMGLGDAPVMSRNQRAEEMGPGSYGYQGDRLDALATSGVVGNMDRNKVNHTLMGPGKYNYLYGGLM